MNAPLDIRHCQDDIQAVVASAFSSLRQCQYALLRIDSAPRARAWIGAQLGAGLVRSVADLDSRRAHPSALALAFTYSGLEALGLDEASDLPFASLFKTGMAHAGRAKLFGDTPARWQWVDVHPDPDGAATAVPVQHPAPGAVRGAGSAPQQVHVLAAYFASGASPALPAFLDGAALAAAGLAHAIAPVASCPAYIQTESDGSTKSYEAFGFRDGISQPVIRGLREASADKAARIKAGALFEDRVVAPGEFLFGHQNEYGEIAVGPGAQWRQQGQSDAGAGFGLNGSFMVVRQYRQFVDAFESYAQMADPVPQHLAPAATNAAAAHACPVQPLARPPTAGEKMIGRTQEGAPLLPAHAAATLAEDSAFRYRLDDAAGFACPRGAHVRRANPRDLLGWDVESGVAAAKLHRLLRRGRTWTEGCKGGTRAEGGTCSEGGTCGAESHRKPEARDKRCGAGLMFIALNADLERQYEFIQQQWLMNQKFGDLYDEADPVLATRAGGTTRHFSIPAVPLGKKLPDLPDFTEVIGGGYFFLPGIAALRFIARGPQTEQPCTEKSPTASP